MRNTNIKPPTTTNITATARRPSETQWPKRPTTVTTRPTPQLPAASRNPHAYTSAAQNFTRKPPTTPVSSDSANRPLNDSKRIDIGKPPAATAKKQQNAAHWQNGSERK